MIWNFFKQIVHIEQIYLDHAGSTIYSQLHLKSYFDDLSHNLYGNPHSKNKSSLETDSMVDEVRKKVLNHLNTSENEYSIIFTLNATKALNLVAKCFAFKSKAHSVNKGLFVYLNDNHTSVVGMRNSVNVKTNADIVCIREHDLEEFVKKRISLKPFEKFESTFVNNLLVYPAQSNFNGRRYPMTWIDDVQNCSGFLGSSADWSVLIDSASYLSTSTIDLSIHKPQFLVLSFYKMFGFPTGLGCLLVNNKKIFLLEKEYFGGGTIDMMLPFKDVQSFRPGMSDKFEDGTLPFLEILAVKHGFDSMLQIYGSFENISNKTFELSRHVYSRMKLMKYNNGQNLVRLYHDENSYSFSTKILQGPIINFNLFKPNGFYIGYTRVEELARVNNIHLRTGCFCNLGACQIYLNLTDEDFMQNFNLGHVCGDGIDIINDRPTGSVRISFGFSSTAADADYFCNFLVTNFLEPGNESLQEFSNFFYLTKFEYVLKEIWIYPIKSCSGIKLGKCNLDTRGLKFDHHWMVINESDGKCINQKINSQLCMIKVKISDISKFILSSEDMELSIDDEPKKNESQIKICEGKICNDRITVNVSNDEINGWFSNVLHIPHAKLVVQSTDDKRTVKQKSDASEKEAFLNLSNEGQYLLIGSASLAYLQKKITDNSVNGKPEFTDLDTLAARFRANFIIETNVPFEEDGWSEIQIGMARFKVIKLCNRCKAISRDQNTGIQHKEPLQSLMKIPNRNVSN
ncbi:hypothetical protein HELRODRAFT_77660 [Helobdella robusta]|uniref:Molybdenum cofactor sulfurase n=1 Tax=Helobdella robusta TaxID=6412 RepID=T1G317_HELRO|nr:hypothetical protein HELRODRAFT_77660 [Helobdella robusta]ESO05303.1 hypothetical protein HELRODRAFT_77660 [Helobdella robusta]